MRLPKRGSKLSRLDPYSVRERDREVPIMLDDAPSVDDRHADHLAVRVVADAMPVRRQRAQR